MKEDLNKIKTIIKSKINKYGNVNNYDILKVFAFFNMVIDHIGYYLFPNILFLRCVGRFSAPIFLILHGYSYKVNDKTNKDRLILFFGCLSSLIIFILEKEIFPLNILITIYLSSKVIGLLEKIYNKNCFFLLTVFIFFIPLGIVLNYFIDYGTFALMLIFAGYLQNRKEKDIKSFLISSFAFTVFSVKTQLIFFTILNNIFLYSLIYFFFMFFLFAFSQNFNEKLKSNVYNIKNKIIKNSILIISRYSLFLYFFHILVILLVKKWLF